MTIAVPDTHVAILRQFLRAVFNDQFAGDEAVALLASRMSEVELEEFLSAEQASSIRPFLRLAIKKWGEVLQADEPLSRFSPEIVLTWREMSDDEMLQRQCGVLVDVFGFSGPDAAVILDLDEAQLETALKKSRSARDHKLSGMALIIEDDPIVAAGVVELAVQIGLQVSEVCDTAERAIQSAKVNPPDVIISDFDLGAGGTGIEAVHSISEFSSSPVVFVTAYPADVLSGQSFEPTFVIGKPYGDRQLIAALQYAMALPPIEVVDGEAQH